MSIYGPELLAKEVNSLGNALFAGVQSRQDSKATFLSPWGVAHILAMALEGVQPGSSSHRQLLAAFSHTNETSTDDVMSCLKTVTALITEKSDGTHLIVADACAAWVAPSIELLPSYIETLDKLFAAHVAPLVGGDDVDNWVARATRGKIKSIGLDIAELNVQLLLTNAVYFKGTWESTFERSTSCSRPFYRLQGGMMDSACMRQKYHKSYNKRTHAAALGAKLLAPLPDGAPAIECVAAKLAYKGGAYAAIVAMPTGEIENRFDRSYKGPLTLKSGHDYGQALTACRGALLCALSGGESPETAELGGVGCLDWIAAGDGPTVTAINLSLPRFEVDFATDLEAALTEAGLGSLFGPGDDFTRIAKGVGMAVGKVGQKLFCKVNEQGTVAAAVTHMAMCETAAMAPPPPPPEWCIDFDRPFVFTIVHKATGVALFCGEVYEPEEWKESEADEWNAHANSRQSKKKPAILQCCCS